MSFPLWNLDPARANAARCGAFIVRHRVCAASISLYNNGSISAICGDIRTHAGKIFDEYRCRAPVSGSILLSLTRGAVTEITLEGGLGSISKIPRRTNLDCDSPARGPGNVPKKSCHSSERLGAWQRD